MTDPILLLITSVRDRYRADRLALTDTLNTVALNEAECEAALGYLMMSAEKWAEAEVYFVAAETLVPLGEEYEALKEKYGKLAEECWKMQHVPESGA